MKSNTLTILTITLIFAAAGYWFFFMSNTIDPSLTQTGAQTDAQIQFQTLLSELGPITFDTKIFSNQNFISLVNIATPITPEPQGRADPFGRI